MHLDHPQAATQLTLLDADRDCAICGRELSAREVELCERCMLREGEFLVLPSEGGEAIGEPEERDAGEYRPSPHGAGAAGLEENR